MDDRQEIHSHIWYTRRDGEVKGPFLAGTIRSFVLLGRLTPQDEISADGEHWLPLHRREELIPDVMKNLGSEADEERLLLARRREDERVGERRQGSAPAEMVNRRTGDRRAPEPQDALSYRRFRRFIWGGMRSGENNLIPAVVWSLSMLLVLAAGVYVYRSLPLQPSPEPDCTALPAPGVVWRNCGLEGLQAPSAELQRAQIDNADLRGANLRGADLRETDLAYTNLSTADLSYADLSEARLVGAGLRNADLSYTRLVGANLSYADLRGANLGAAELSGARLGKAIWLDGRTCAPDSVGRCQ